MKAIRISFLFLVSLFICGNISAQLPISVGAKVGMNLSEIQKLDDDIKVGFNVGVTVELALPSDFAIISGLEFTTKGAKGAMYYSDELISSTRYEDVKFNAMYLQLPVHAAYKFNVASATKLVVELGPYFAYGVGGKIKADAVGSLPALDEDFFDDDTNRFDFGIGGAVGVELMNKINIKLGADQGLTKVVKDTSMKNRCAYISVGYKFF